MREFSHLRTAISGSLALLVVLGGAGSAAAHWTSNRTHGIGLPSAATSTALRATGTHRAANSRVQAASPLDAGYCVLGRGAEGAAATDALNILAFGLTTDAKAGLVMAQIKLSNLSGGPGGTPNVDSTNGGADMWEVSFEIAKTQYWVRARFPGYGADQDNANTMPIDFQYGSHITVPVEGDIHASTTFTTGRFDQKTNIIRIDFPMSAAGLKAGMSLDVPAATTYDSRVITPVETISSGTTADAVGAADGWTYAAGQTCGANQKLPPIE